MRATHQPAGTTTPARLPPEMRSGPKGHNCPVTRWLMLHGAGSTPEFIHRAFGPTAAARGLQLLAPQVGGVDMSGMFEVIRDARLGPGDIVGGVSLGAHAAATYCAQSGWAGRLYAVMPAWIGNPGPVAELTAATADALEAHPLAQVLAGIAAAARPDDWIVAELRQAWTNMPQPELVRALRVAAAQPGPAPPELRLIRAATCVVALADDPTHPEQVARTWARSIVSARLRVLPRDLAGAGPGALAGPLLTPAE